MANHRAGRSAPAPRGEAAATSGPPSAPSAPGKRKAAKPGRAARVETPAPKPVGHRAQVETPAPKPVGHRAQVETPAPKPVGHRAHLARRKRLFPALPSSPALIGAAALAVAAAGAVTVGQGPSGSVLAAGNLQKLSAQANVLNGASSIGSSNALVVRKQAASRDSERQALAAAADEEVQAVAEAEAEQRSAALAQLAASAEKHARQIAKNAWVLPVALGAYHLTAGFGASSGLWSHNHTGLDFAAPYGTTIYSVANGVVTDVGYDGAYGNKTVVTLEDGTEIWYCHQADYGVSVGETVTGGQEIGHIGTTGNTTGAHLHLEVRPGAGDPVDPYSAMTVHGLRP